MKKEIKPGDKVKFVGSCLTRDGNDWFFCNTYCTVIDNNVICSYQFPGMVSVRAIDKDCVIHSRQITHVKRKKEKKKPRELMTNTSKLPSDEFFENEMRTCVDSEYQGAFNDGAIWMRDSFAKPLQEKLNEKQKLWDDHGFEDFLFIRSMLIVERKENQRLRSQLAICLGVLGNMQGVLEVDEALERIESLERDGKDE